MSHLDPGADVGSGDRIFVREQKPAERDQGVDGAGQLSLGWTDARPEVISAAGRAN